MKSEIVISVEGAGKKFCRTLRRGLIYGTRDLVADFFSIKQDRLHLRPDEFWSLKEISFDVRKGETLAFIGLNGSGKSTLLRLIAGIYTPDLGRLTIRGRVGVLIALGAGFHPQMTGMENIYLNGSILGLKKDEIDQRLQSIVSFSELGDFIHSPVSTYSSGMSVRLGFAIASHCDADILLVDEVLAVGDLAFTLKCYRKMSEFRKNGGTTILVSHSNQLVRNFCDRAIWLDKGLMQSDGPVHEVCDQYERATTKSLVEEYIGQVVSNDELVRIESIEILNKSGAKTEEVEVGESITVRFAYNAQRLVENPIFSVTIENLENQTIVSNFSNFDGAHISPLQGKGIVEVELKNIQLKRGRYFISATLAEKEINNVLYWMERTHRIAVYGGLVSYGVYNPFPTWKSRD